MTIIENAVKRLEKARQAQPADTEDTVVGEVVDRKDLGLDSVATGTYPALESIAPDSITALPASDRDADKQAAPATDVPGIGAEEDVEDDHTADAVAEGASAEASSVASAAMGLTGSHRIVRVTRDRLREAGLLAPEDEERQLVDQYRHIKRPLIAHAFGKRATKIEDGHLIMVASALAGEGKTFTCINLALSMARERDVTVLLVDADVAKPHISRLFGAESEPGLLDVLDEPERYDHRSVVMATDVPGLALMPAGVARPHASELLASDRMETLVAKLGEEDPNRLVVFDSPPLLQTSEARILASVIGQVALVVRAGVTPQHVVLDAVNTLHEDKAVNLILNQARYCSSEGYYGGYHAYGSYGDPGAQEQRA